MKPSKSVLRRAYQCRPLAAAALAVIPGILSVRPAGAATLAWDPGMTPATPTGGSGTWVTNGTPYNWSNGSTDVAWTDTTGTDTAVFGTTGGTVALSGTDVANAVVFNVSGYALAGGTLSLAQAAGAPTPSITANFNAAISSTIAGTAGVTFAGAGTLTLSGTNTGLTSTAAAQLNVSSGKVVMGSYFALGNSTDAAFVNVSSGAALDLHGYAASNGEGFLNTVYLSGTGTDGTGVLLNSTGGGGYTAFNTGWQQNPNVVLTGNALVNLANPFGQIASGYGTTYLTLNGNTLTKTGAGGYYLADTTVGSGNLNVTGGSVVLLPLGAGATITGTGTITIGDGNGNGTLAFNASQSAGTITRPITLNGGTLAVANAAQVDSPINVNATAVAGVFNVFNASSSLVTATLTGTINSSTGLIKTGNGTLLLSGTSNNLATTAALPINVSAGRVVMGSYGAVGKASTDAAYINVSSGAAFDVHGYGVASGEGFLNTISIAGSGPDGNGALLNSTGGGGYNFFYASAAQSPNLTLTGDALVNFALPFTQLAGSYATTTVALNNHSLTVTGTGGYVLVDATVGNGNLNVSSGTLSLIEPGGSPATRIQGTGTVTIGDGVGDGALALDPKQAAGLITRPITVNGGTITTVISVATGGSYTEPSGNSQIDSPITLNAAAATNTFTASGTNGLALTGAIAGLGGMTKAGAGTLTLSGSNAYAGPTTINAGTLLANTAGAGNSSTGTGTTTVNAGGVLAGTGSAGPVVVNGGTITAGTGALSTNTVGTLFTGSQNWSSGSFVAKVSSTGGTGNDELVMFGLTVAATSGSPFNVSVASTSGTQTLAAGSYLVLAVDTDASASSDPFSSANAAATLAKLTLTTSGLTTPNGYPALSTQPDTSAGGTGTGGYDLIVVAAPEPGSLTLLGVVAASLLGRRGGRRRSGRAAPSVS